MQALRVKKTLPVRGATAAIREELGEGGFQSTLPVRGATNTAAADKTRYRFQSTLPVRGATFAAHRAGDPESISIHAPREGSDHLGILIDYSRKNFNPRSP